MQEPELDFDDLNDFLGEIKPSVELIVMEDPTNAARTAREAEEDAVYAGERDSCCGESQNDKHDNALDSTFQSWHMHEDLSYFSALDHSLDNSQIDTS